MFVLVINKTRACARLKIMCVWLRGHTLTPPIATQNELMESIQLLEYKDVEKIVILLFIISANLRPSM